MELTVEVVESLAKILDAHKLDSLKFGELELVKSRHEGAVRPASKVMGLQDAPVDPDELLYWSSQASNLTPEEESTIREVMADTVPE